MSRAKFWLKELRNGYLLCPECKCAEATVGMLVGEFGELVAENEALKVLVGLMVKFTHNEMEE